MTDARVHATAPDTALRIAAVTSIYQREFPGATADLEPGSEKLGFNENQIVFQFDHPFPLGYVILAIAFNRGTGQIESVYIDCVRDELDPDWEPSFYVHESVGSYWLGALIPAYANQFARIAKEIYELFVEYRLPA